ncbi:MAG: hypothetical protein IT546_11520 [Caulobacteraceae bacterium]|nr:hypothetical protein [Caulobacteraceae bacterium]
MATQTVGDNRRAVVRVLAHEVMRGLRDLALLYEGDLIRALVFTAISSSNTLHLHEADTRYASIYDLPPDRERRPVTMEDLVDSLLMPREIVERYVAILCAEGVCESTPSGYVVPTAVFTRPEMLDGLNEFYTGTVRLVTALQNAGFRVGDAR